MYALLGQPKIRENKERGRADIDLHGLFWVWGLFIRYWAIFSLALATNLSMFTMNRSWVPWLI